MGLGRGADGTLWMSSLYQLWRFENFLDPAATKDGYDAVYVPVTGHTTGDIDIHDIHADADGRRSSSPPASTASRRSPSAPASRRSGGRRSSTGSPPRTAAT